MLKQRYGLDGRLICETLITSASDAQSATHACYADQPDGWAAVQTYMCDAQGTGQAQEDILSKALEAATCAASIIRGSRYDA